MLTLDQVRAVNDGFKSGDLNAALRPLEETVDLRVNELPRLDKAALAALKTGLQNGEDAATWAEALFHPNISVRRFARKAFMGLGDEAAPLFEPLRDRLQRFWSEVPPLTECNKAREAALRREQQEMVNSAVELLLRSNPQKFVAFYTHLKDAVWLRANEEQADAIKEWRNRTSKASEATQKETDRILKEEWGEEWVASGKRWRLPSRVLRDIDERVRQNPEIAKLWAELGVNPYERISVEWHPTAVMSAMMGNYLSDYNATGPMRRIGERLRPIFWSWLREAFDTQNPPEIRRKSAKRLFGDNGWWVMVQWLGTEQMKAELLPVLLQAKPSLLSAINKRIGSQENLYHIEEEGEEVITLLARIWVFLALTLTRFFRPPYNVKIRDWPLPNGVQAADLRELTEGLKASKTNKSYLDEIISAADNVEQARRAQSIAEEEEPSPEPEVVTPRSSLWTPIGVLSAYEVLSSDQLQSFYAVDGDQDKVQERINAAVRRIEEGIAAITEAAARIQILAELPPLPDNPGSTVTRKSYWQIWTKDMGEEAAQTLKESLWGKLEPRLWKRLDDRLEAYRRAETDPIEPKIEQKLTEREAKEWRAQTRRDKRALLQRDIHDIANLLVQNDGITARLRTIEMADRPSCRDLRDQFEKGLFAEVEHFPGEYGHNTSPISIEEWNAWKLGADWDGTLEKMELRLSESKENDWQQAILRRQLATGFYRRGNFAKFEHYAVTPNAFPRPVAMAVVPFDDFEAWRVLLLGANQWGGDPLTVFWKAQIQDETRKERAMRAAVEVISTTSEEGVAKSLFSWLDELPADEMRLFVNQWERALESSLPVVRRRAMTLLGTLQGVEFDRESAAQTAGEALWSETSALAKDAAKFLSQISADDADVAATSWELLGDATALDNLAVNETVYRALSQIKSKHKDLILPDAAREKLDDLVAVNSERFAKFQKKLT